MIRSIKIRNFQALDKLDLELSDHINIISGKSDSGKTSVIRSLNWLIENKPNGFEFRRDPRKNKSGKKPLSKEEYTECSIITEHGEITRLRNESSGENGFNGYVLPDDSEREALKGEVPEEVLDILNISRYNIQMQHDPIFMLSDTPGEIARKINEVTQMDTIDTIRKRCDGIISETKSKVDILNDQIEDTQSQITELQFVDEANKRIIQLEKIGKELLVAETELQSLIKIVNVIGEINDEMGAMLPLFAVENKTNLVLELIDEYNKNDIRSRRLLNLTDEIQDLQLDIEANDYLLHLEKVVNNLLDMIKQAFSMEDRIDEMSSLIDDIGELQDDCAILNSKIENEKEQYFKLIKQAGQCPTCGSSVIDKKQIEKHLEIHV